ncbi:hypothetical protein LZ554_007218 [Drepanopeziza brunnea f. sp. 'monogermtubi']|nr:hypothetical protein LZ554_007218 [Drepanopeziza brunnea f. sp. 'monogermtubi']
MRTNMSELICEQILRERFSLYALSVDAARGSRGKQGKSHGLKRPNQMRTFTCTKPLRVFISRKRCHLVTRTIDRSTDWESQERTNAANIQRGIRERPPGTAAIDPSGLASPVDYSNLGMLDSSLPLDDQHSFPTGFFDVMAPTFDAGSGH